MSLAESVVILMRYAAIREIQLNTEVQKPSLAEFRAQGWIVLKNQLHIQKLMSTRQPMMEAK